MESRIKILDRLIEEGKSYTFRNFCLPRNDRQNEFGGADSPEWSTFKIRVKNTISEIVSEASPAMKLVEIGLSTRTEGNYSDKFVTSKNNLIKALEITRAILEDDVYGELKEVKSGSNSPSLSNKIFIVHGHDQVLKTDVERFVHEIGLVPVVLHRETDQGATIIEKFEKHSDVGYVFVLLTSDEVSFTVDQENIEDNERIKEYRARPNVIFEFGYFVGKLGRNRVCCLYKGKITLPSDLNGLIYKKVEDSIDSQAYSIIKELKAVGYNIKVGS